jgi:hypothetical protein
MCARLFLEVLIAISDSPSVPYGWSVWPEDGPLSLSRQSELDIADLPKYLSLELCFLFATWWDLFLGLVGLL